MIDHYIRPLFQRLLADPLASRFEQKINIHPNYVTLIGCLLGIVCGVAIYFHLSYLALVLLLLSGLMDSMDGTIARMKHVQGPSGAILDILCDRIVEFAVVFGLYAYDPNNRGALAFLMLGSILICVTSFLVVGIFVENNSQKSFHYSPGLMERAEAFIFFGLMIIFPHHFGILAILFSALVILTAGIRVGQFMLNEDLNVKTSAS